MSRLGLGESFQNFFTCLSRLKFVQRALTLWYRTSTGDLLGVIFCVVSLDTAQSARVRHSSNFGGSHSLISTQGVATGNSPIGALFYVRQPFTRRKVRFGGFHSL